MRLLRPQTHTAGPRRHAEIGATVNVSVNVNENENEVETGHPLLLTSAIPTMAPPNDRGLPR